MWRSPSSPQIHQKYINMENVITDAEEERRKITKMNATRKNRCGFRHSIINREEWQKGFNICIIGVSEMKVKNGKII